jgi:CBS domain-containing protein
MCDGLFNSNTGGMNLKTKDVKGLMLQLSEYATVSKDATLAEAVLALKKSHDEFDKSRYRHRAVLVLDETGSVIGKVGFTDILKGLEPKYDEMLSDKGAMHVGFTRSFQKTMLESLKLWEDPMEHICRKAAQKKVASFIKPISEGEYIEEKASLNEAIHQLVLGHHQSLLVVGEGKKITGILRLTDVFEAVTQEILACKI